MFKSALIIVDMQNDFVNPKGNLYVPDAEQIVEPINKTIEQFMKNGAQIVYTQDWHNENSKIFEQWPKHCVANTWGAELAVKVYNPADAIFIKKGLYDFENYGAFEGEPDLHKLLKLRGVEEVFICGVAGDYCVYWTTFQALKLGFKTYVILDLIKSIDEKKTMKLFDKLKKDYGLGILVGYSATS